MFDFLRFSVCACAVVALVSACSGTAVAQSGLTSSERLSIRERDPTEEERAQHGQLCSDWTRTATPFVLDGVVGATVQFPDLRIVLLFLMAEGVAEPGSDPQRSLISRFPDLPYGGIAGAHFCDDAGLVLRDSTASAVSPTKMIWRGLRLIPGLDLAREYPNAERAIRERGQIYDAAGRYFFTPGNAEIEDMLAFPSVDPDAPILDLGERGILVRLRD